MDQLTALCKRRGFIYPGSEIYGGFANSYTYGPYGAQLKNNIKNLWWKTFVEHREDVVGIPIRHLWIGWNWRSGTEGNKLRKMAFFRKYFYNFLISKRKDFFETEERSPGNKSQDLMGNLSKDRRVSHTYVYTYIYVCASIYVCILGAFWAFLTIF